MKIHLLVIDPQNDFCNPNGSLFVPGADKDIDRLSQMVRRLKGKLDDIHITLDSHRKVDISHPMWWKDSSGKRPGAFTLITAADMESGKWDTYMPSFRTRTLAYLKALETRGRYLHTVWPEHCLIGDEGHNVHPLLSSAVHEWEDSRFAQGEFLTKGSNPFTEHFSAVAAEVPDPNDPSTQVNTDFIKTLEGADMILLAGQALSHCVANTVLDIAANFSNTAYIQKLHLLTDATSEVPNPPGMTIFSDFTARFLNDMRTQGMKLTTTTDVLT
jgi:nicotinamidase-related amidase